MAEGLAYLHEKGVIHSDIPVRHPIGVCGMFISSFHRKIFLSQIREMLLYVILASLEGSLLAAR